MEAEELCRKCNDWPCSCLFDDEDLDDFLLSEEEDIPEE